MGGYLLDVPAHLARTGRVWIVATFERFEGEPPRPLLRAVELHPVR